MSETSPHVLHGRLGATASDEDLMLRVQADESLALDCLYRRHVLGAQRVARSVCRDRGRAEDAVQDAFISIWRGRSGYRPIGSFRGWLMRSVRNQALDSVRSDAAKKRPPAARRDSVPVADRESHSPLQEVIDQGESAALKASLDHLPAAQAQVIRLAFFGGLTHEEIAHRLKLPSGTVKGRMRLGLDKMRTSFEDPGHRISADPD